MCVAKWTKGAFFSLLVVVLHTQGTPIPVLSLDNMVMHGIIFRSNECFAGLQVAYLGAQITQIKDPRFQAPCTKWPRVGEDRILKYDLMNQK